MDSLIGTTLDDKYLLKGVAYETDYFTVFQATDVKSEENVGVRLLKPAYQKNAAVSRRFRSNWQRLSTFESPYIVNALDVKNSKSGSYVVTEPLSGTTLRRFLERQKKTLPYHQALNFAEQVCQGLADAHAHGVVHYSLNPRHLVISKEGTLKIQDFGIDRLAYESAGYPGERAIDVVNYCSPEQAKGQTSDHRADIYSVGVLLYEMLTGRLPYGATSVTDAVTAQINQNPPPISEYNKQVPQGIVDIALIAMQKEPLERYNNIDDMLQDLQRLKTQPSHRFLTDEQAAEIQAAYPPVSAELLVPQSGVHHLKNRLQTGWLKFSRDPDAAGEARPLSSYFMPVLVGLTIAVMFACFFLSYTLFKNSGNPMFSEYKDIDLPDFTGMLYEEVEEMLTKDPYKYLRLQEPSYEDDPQVPPGQIMSQNPTSSNKNPKKVKANQRVYVIVARGIEDIKIPDMIGLPRKEAQQQVLDLGLRPYLRRVDDTNAAPGTIIESDPAPGKTVRNLPDTVVTLLYASERHDFDTRVPAVTNMSLKDAQQRLATEGLQTGTITYMSSSAPAGTVLRQNPSSGTKIAVGGTVDLMVSSGTPQETEPPSSEVDDLPDPGEIRPPDVTPPKEEPTEPDEPPDEPAGPD